MKKTVTGTWMQGKKMIDVNLSIIIFKEDDTHLVYCPALNLTGYGDSEDQAMQSFEVVLSEYFNYTTNKQTLEADLQKIGWNNHLTQAKKNIYNSVRCGYLKYFTLLGSGTPDFM